jgi:dolichol-phosphate mannosyltransferase
MSHLKRADATISVVLPLLNEAAILHSLVGEIEQQLVIARVDYEIVLVNDGSTDESEVILNDLAESSSHITSLHLSRNFGHASAVSAGLDHASGEAVILMDCDGQDDPKAIPKLIALWQDGNDVVNVVRASRTESTFKRALFSGFYKLLSSVSSTPMVRDAGNFGLIDRIVVDQLSRLPERDRYYPGLRAWVGYRQTSIAVDRLARHDATPRVNLRGLISLAKTALFGFSRVPLHAFYWLAGFSALLSIGCILFAIFHKLFTGLAIPGWASVTSITAFFGAINAFGIAILGEYIARIYDQVRGRPPYLVSRVVTRSQGRTPSGLQNDLEVQLLAQSQQLQRDAKPESRTAREPSARHESV